MTAIVGFTSHGATHLDHLFICSADQGFVGIASGIGVANLHCMRE